MKHIQYFDAFLRDTVNLNQARIDLLEERVETIERYLTDSDYEPPINRYSPQGSWAHKTIIKPPGDNDFDADLLVIVDYVPGWKPWDYVGQLLATFTSGGTYKELASARTRCVKLDYSGDFHLDVVPILRWQEGSQIRFFACNSRDDRFEETAPEAYTSWVVRQNAIAGGNNFRKVVRLLKYLRDVKGTFSAKSILLTTLVGIQVAEFDDVISDQNFPDLPTSLETIIVRLDDFLQARPQIPEIQNPVLPLENFNRHWDQEKYDIFRSQTNKYRAWIVDAQNEPDANESIAKWRRVFGDEFAPSLAIKTSSRALTELFTFAERWLGTVRQAGRTALARFPVNQEHVRRPPWKMDANQLSITVDGALARTERGQIIQSLSSGDVVPRAHSLRFVARIGLGLPETFSVHWRVVNTGGEAAAAGQLRGGFRRAIPTLFVGNQQSLGASTGSKLL